MDWSLSGALLLLGTFLLALLPGVLYVLWRGRRDRARDNAAPGRYRRRSSMTSADARRPKSNAGQRNQPPC